MPLSSCYVGAPPLVALLPDGRDIKLLSEFSFHDSNSISWVVPKGATVDGASIPQIFWSFMGGPFEGRYRDASIIHDWYCDVRVRTWEATHRTFYEAMLVSGVSQLKAKVMYFAVRWGGPRWEPRTRANTELALSLSMYLEPYQHSEIIVWDQTGVYGSEKLSAEILEAIREKRPFTHIRMAGDTLAPPASRAPILNRSANSVQPVFTTKEQFVDTIKLFISNDDPDLNDIDNIADSLKLNVL